MPSSRDSLWTLIKARDKELKAVRDKLEHLTKVELPEKEGALQFVSKRLGLVGKENSRLEEENSRLESKIKNYLRFIFQKIVTGWLARKLIHYLRPGLGVLYQYPPRPTDTHYSKNTSIQPSVFPSIAIVIPSFQQGDFIKETLESVLNQHYPKLRVHVQDGGSTDETVQIIKKYQSSTLSFESCKDAGQAAAVNVGFDKVSGEIMAWLNSDDVLMPGALNVVADFFNRHPDVDVVFANRVIINQDSMEVGIWVLPGHDGDVLSWVDFVPQETLFWRKSAWEKIGGKLDQNYQFAMDWDLILRFRDAGANFSHIPYFLGGFRVHPKQKTQFALEQGLIEMNSLRQRTLGFVPSQKQIRRAIFPYILKHVAWTFAYKLRRKIFRFLKNIEG